MAPNVNEVEKGVTKDSSKVSLEETSNSALETPLTSSSLAKVVPPHESYEGFGHWDPAFTWTADEEKKVIRKTDFFLLSAV